ncbi:MAG: thermonuclease family protein [Thermodesulfobacteriota bacterium]
MTLDSYKIYLTLFLIFLVSCNISGGKENYLVLDVIDGDTVLINNPKVERLRYLGMNAPENLTNYSPGDPFYLHSTKLNDELVNGKKITIEYDEEKYDPYGRLLGYVFVDGLLVNEEIVRQGLARVFFIGPNRKYESRIKKAQKDAQIAKRGIWGNLNSFKTTGDNKGFLINTVNARDYLDQRVVVRGKIKELSKKNSKVTVLNMEDDLNLVFFSDTYENFIYFGIDPANFYTGKPVEVIGRVKMYRGSPQIVVSHPISIKVIN